METENLYKIKNRFATRMVGDDLVVVPLVNNVAQMERLYTFNETAGFLWEQLSAGTTTESLITMLLDNFEVERDRAEADVRNFLDKIQEISKF